jgi:hypothetical protein
MSKFVVEYKRKSSDGFTHARRIIEETSPTDGQNQIASIFNTAFQFGAEGVEFFTVKLVKEKPAKIVKPEVKK